MQCNQQQSLNEDMSQGTNPFELPISGSVGGGEIELKIESETHKYFQIHDKRLRLTRPLDRDAILKEVSFNWTLEKQCQGRSSPSSILPLGAQAWTRLAKFVTWI